MSKATAKSAFLDLEYGPAPESPAVAYGWLDDHEREFGHFIDNQWVKPDGRKFYETKNPATGETLSKTIQGTKEDVDLAVASNVKAAESWSKLPGHVRARYMYSIARHVQKHARLIAVVESLDNGKTIRETRDFDVPTVARHMYHYAGWAQLKDTEMKEWGPVGVVGAIVPWNFPLMLLTWKVAPALAMGNTITVKPATYTRLSALLFAEICAEAGLPPGVFNVLTGGGAMGSMLADHPNVDKVGFTGSTQIGQLLRRLTAGSGKKISLELGGKSPFIVFDDADIDSAVEGVVDAIWFNQGQVCSAGSRLLVQETVYDKVISKVKRRMGTLRVGDSLDKCMDMGAVVDPKQRDTVSEFVEGARAEGADIYQACACFPTESAGHFYPPTLITNVNTVSSVVREEIFGPVLVAQSFRTAKEAIKIANNCIYGLAGSVWSENISNAMEVAVSVKAGTMWINGHNV
jgi:aldehyde dehydrogenase (NAD+)